VRRAGGGASGLSRSASSGAAHHIVERVEQPGHGQRSTPRQAARRHVRSVAAKTETGRGRRAYDFGEICVMSTP
jgi:hypothetical protein